MIKRMKDLEAENQRLKKMYAESKMDADILKDALAGKYRGHLSVKGWPSKFVNNMDYPLVAFVG